MPRKITVSLKRPRTASGTITYAKHVAASMAGNPYFPSPPVPIATLLAHIADLDAAEVATKTGAHGTAAERNAKLAIVLGDLRQLRTYVEAVALQHAEDAEAVVVSSGLSIKQSSGPKKPSFAVKQLKVSGRVRMSARHPGDTASFDWQFSNDAIHWVDAPRTTAAHVDVGELTPGVLYSFRYRMLTNAGLGDWSDPVKLMVT